MIHFADESDDDHHSYTFQDLKMFDLLQHPVWIFDGERKAMFWANNAALKVWRADSLDELLSRDFASDLSSDREYRLNEMLVQYENGEVTNDEITFYPNGVPTSLRVTGSGIRIDGGRMACLSEAELPNKQTYEDLAVRGMEILRKMPLPVFQFDINGTAIGQNPEAMNVFGGAKRDFKEMFVDEQLGEKGFQQVTSGVNYDAEVEQHTTTGVRWFSISARLTKDPITSDSIILLVAHDITETVQARLDKVAAKFKIEFMAILAHDIRTPLHQIIGYLDLLELSGLTTEQLEHVKLVQVSATSLMALANDLLDFSKVESGNLRIENSRFEIQELLSGCIAAAEADSREKDLKIISNYVVSDLPAQTIGDPFRLRQIILNLLSNSVKFTSSGSITLTVAAVACSSDCCRLRFEVADTGIGIEKNQQEHLFGKYSQANSSVAMHYGGTGLGLAICKGLIELMGGGIGLRSAFGKGTTVFFEIPLQIPPLEHDSKKNKPRSAPVEHQPLSILVAEDNKINQRLIRVMLQSIGHYVTIAENGQIAVDLVERESFDLVLMDVQMPIMDGIAATKKIRSLGFCKSKLAVVGLTASFQHSELDSYLEIGMNDCLGKPVRLINLKGAIAAVLTR